MADDDDDEETDPEEEKSSKSLEKQQKVKKTKKKKPKTRAGRKKARLAKEKAAREMEAEVSKKKKQAKTALAFASLATDAVEDSSRVKQPFIRIAPHKTRDVPTTIEKPLVTPKQIHHRSPTVIASPTTFGKTKSPSKQPSATTLDRKVTPTAFGGTTKPVTTVGTTFGSKFPPQTKKELKNGAKKMVSFIQNVDSEAEEVDEAIVSQLGATTQEQSNLPTVSQLGAKKPEATKVGGMMTALEATSSEVLPPVSQLATKMGGNTAATSMGSTTDAPLPTVSQLATKMSQQTTASEGPLPTVSQLGAVKMSGSANILLEGESTSPKLGAKSPTQEEAFGADRDDGIADSTLTASQLAAKTEVKPTQKHPKDFSKKIATKKDHPKGSLREQIDWQGEELHPTRPSLEGAEGDLLEATSGADAVVVVF
uniref:Uncharacterized protein n=1 Tax=Romanomermis culicivorax TaxID=13658 RepID=A0A915J3S1_ROMCU